MILLISLPQNIKTYTSVQFDKAEMDVVRVDIESSVLDHGFTNDCIVTFKEVSRAIDKLISGKGDGMDSLKTDHSKIVIGSCQFMFLYFCRA